MMKLGAHLLIGLLVALLGSALCAQPAEETLHFGFEMGGKLVGYVKFELRSGETDGRRTRICEAKLLARLILLGSDLDIKAVSIFHEDAATGRALLARSDISQGGARMGGTVEVVGNEATYSPLDGSEPTKIDLSGGVRVAHPLNYPHLARQQGPGTPKTRVWKVFDPADGKVHERECTREGTERLVVRGKEREAAVYGIVDRTNGVKEKVWLVPGTGRILKAELPNDVVLRAAEPSVVGQIERFDLDDSIFARVDVAIADYKEISYLKVKGRIHTAGEWVTAESLNVPGQKFEGTVTDNLIDGTFEIEHPRYDGKGALAFPAPAGATAGLEKFLDPESLIEVDDPGVRSRAAKLTAGAKNAWDATLRLSQWVCDEVEYAIPGGGAAKRVLETRKGECAGHSRLLTALCRSTGIPARLATGCMYTPLYGGSFGQHAWTEVWMGKEAGWIPVDCTAEEIGYVDSAHVRIGSEASFTPKSMEILDYRPKPESTEEEEKPLSFDQLPWKPGKTYTFRYVVRGKPFGTDSFTFEQVDTPGAGPAWRCKTKLDIEGMTSTGEWVLSTAGRPLDYKTEGKVRGTTDFFVRCTFSEGEVVEKAKQGEREFDRTVELPDPCYLVDNNQLSLFAFLLAGVPRQEGFSKTIKVFHPSSMRVLVMKITVKGKEEIELSGKRASCTAVDILLAGTPISMWVDDQGRLVRDVEAGGKMVVELVR